MPAPALLDLGCELLRAVLRFDAPTDAVVAAFFRQHRQLGPRDRHALAEAVYALLRQRLRFEHLARGGPGRLERRLLLLAWPHGERGLPGLLEAEVDWLVAAQTVDASSLPAPLRHNLPEWLAAALQAESPHDDLERLAAALNQPAPLDLRVNTLRAKREDVIIALAAAGITARPTPYSPWGLRVEGKPALVKLEAFERGDFEVQDEGSQLLALLTQARRGEVVVDFCAGAGGKTLALGAMMRDTGRLYAFDVSGHRLDALKPRLQRSGLANVYPAQIGAERDERLDRLAGKVDRVLVDAPCSGLGTLRRQPDLKWRMSMPEIDALQATQAALLGRAARLLKPGGRLVYATCSLLEAENEAVASAFTESERDFRVLPVDEILVQSKVASAHDMVRGDRLRLWPHRHGTDGFFAAVWQKN